MRHVYCISQLALSERPMHPSVQRAVIPNIYQQSISNSGQSFFAWYGQTQGLLVRLSNLITKRSD